MLKKIISGGQTGVDQIGLEVAKNLGYETGGTIPRGFMTEKGSMPSLGTIYGLKESPSPDYSVRTVQNIRDSDATVLFGDLNSPGTKLTANSCIKLGKPYLQNPTIAQLVSFLEENNIEILNIAGNRKSKLSERQAEDINKLLLNALEIIRHKK